MILKEICRPLLIFILAKESLLNPIPSIFYKKLPLTLFCFFCEVLHRRCDKVAHKIFKSDFAKKFFLCDSMKALSK